MYLSKCPKVNLISTHRALGHQWSVSRAVRVSLTSHSGMFFKGTTGDRIVPACTGLRDLFLTFFSYLFRTPSWRPCWSHWMPFWSLLPAILSPFWLLRATKMKSEMHPHLQEAKPLNLHIVAHFSLFLWSPRLSKTSQNQAEKPKEDTKKRGNDSLNLCRPVLFLF